MSIFYVLSLSLPPFDWGNILVAFLGGGAVAKMIDLIAFRDHDAAQQRAELWKEVGAHRERVQQLEKLLISSDAEAEEQRNLKHDAINEIMMLKLQKAEVIAQANTMLKSLGHEPVFKIDTERVDMFHTPSLENPPCEPSKPKSLPGDVN